MTNNEFKLWLSGYLILTDDSILDRKQLKIIKDHANLVRAITKSLDNKIDIFISALELAMRDGNSISISEVKQNWEPKGHVSSYTFENVYDET